MRRVPSWAVIAGGFLVVPLVLLALPGTTSRVSVSSGGAQANGASWGPRISADGRYVAFISTAPNLVQDDTNGCEDVFVRDRATGETTRVSVASNGTEANQGHHVFQYPPTCCISADGRYVAFVSYATNLVAKDSNWAGDVFVHDRATGTTERVNVSSDGDEADEDSFCPSISADGRYVAFMSYAGNLVPGDWNRTEDYRGEDVFVHDRQTGQTTRVSVASDGTEGWPGADSDEWEWYPPWCQISANGRYVAFSSFASNLVGDDTNGGVYWGCSDVFVHDRVQHETTRVSVTSLGGQANYDSCEPSISGDGRYVAFSSSASNLVQGDSNGKADVFVHDRVTGETRRVSVASEGSQGNGDSTTPAVSADGQWVAFVSKANNLVSGDTNDSPDDPYYYGVDVFVHGLVGAQTTRASVSSYGAEGNRNSFSPCISADGRCVAFASEAWNLVAGDSNWCCDVFLHDRLASPPVPGDLDGDGKATWDDLPGYLQAWRDAAAGGQWNPAADMDGDGKLTASDAALFVEAALGG